MIRRFAAAVMALCLAALAAGPFAARAESPALEDTLEDVRRLEELAEGNVDIDAFVYRNGTVVPADQVDDTSDPGIHTAPEKNYAI